MSVKEQGSVREGSERRSRWREIKWRERDGGEEMRAQESSGSKGREREV